MKFETLESVIRNREIYGNSAHTIQFFTQLREQQQAIKLAALKEGRTPLNTFIEETKRAVRMGDFNNILLLIDLISETESVTKRLEIKTQLIDCFINQPYFERCSLSLEDLEKVYEFFVGDDEVIVVPETELLMEVLQATIQNPRLAQGAVSLLLRFVEDISRCSEAELLRKTRKIEETLSQNAIDPRPVLIEYMRELIGSGCIAAVNIRNRLVWGILPPGASALQRQATEIKETKSLSNRLLCGLHAKLVEMQEPSALFLKAIAIIYNQYHTYEDWFGLMSTRIVSYHLAHYRDAEIEDGFQSLLLAEQLQEPNACEYAKKLRAAGVNLGDTYVAQPRLKT